MVGLFTHPSLSCRLCAGLEEEKEEEETEDNLPTFPTFPTLP